MSWQWLSIADRETRILGKTWWYLLFAMGCCFLPFLWFTNRSITVFICTCYGIKLIWVITRRRYGNILVFSLLGISSIAILITQYISQGVGGIFFTFLILAAGGKLLETRNRRDIKVLFLLGILLITAWFMSSQGILLFVWMLASLTSLFSLLMVSHHPYQKLAFTRMMSIWGKLFCSALPISILIFFLFPRLPPLWGLNSLREQDTTGLPDSMDMENITSLAKSHEVAFRVTFSGNIPPQDMLYWRGPVLEQYDGKSWLPAIPNSEVSKESLDYKSENVVQYSIIPANEDKQWLTALDMPIINDSPFLSVQQNRQIHIRERNKRIRRYELSSAMNYRLGENRLSLSQQTRLTKLPAGETYPKTQALAEQLRRQAQGDTVKFALAFMAYIRNSSFSYSLSPPSDVGNPDIFLFTKKIGYCSQYANAMAITAREAGIPARIIIGYQGGQLNPMTNNWVVRNENAHAWVELWDDKAGWLRYDPTMAASIYVNSNNQSESLDSRTIDAQIGKVKYSWLRNISDAAETQWQIWVINFNAEQHQRVWQHIKAISFLLFLVFLIIMLLVLGRFWIKKRNNTRVKDALEKEIQRLIQYYATQNIEYYPSKGFAHFLREIGKITDKEKIFNQIAEQYEAVRFGKETDFMKLKNKLRRLRKQESIKRH